MRRWAELPRHGDAHPKLAQNERDERGKTQADQGSASRKADRFTCQLSRNIAAAPANRAHEADVAAAFPQG